MFPDVSCWKKRIRCCASGNALEWQPKKEQLVVEFGDIDDDDDFSKLWHSNSKAANYPSLYSFWLFLCVSFATHFYYTNVFITGTSTYIHFNSFLSSSGMPWMSRVGGREHLCFQGRYPPLGNYPFTLTVGHSYYFVGWKVIVDKSALDICVNDCMSHGWHAYVHAILPHQKSVNKSRPKFVITSGLTMKVQ